LPQIRFFQEGLAIINAPNMLAMQSLGGIWAKWNNSALNLLKGGILQKTQKGD